MVKKSRCAIKMDQINDDDRRHRLRLLEDRIQDPRSIVNVDCLLDTVQALVADCDHPSVKRMKNVEAYTNRCKSLKLTYQQQKQIILHFFFVNTVVHTIFFP